METPLSPVDGPYSAFLRSMARFEKTGKLDPHGGFILAVSGGSDSMALATMFALSKGFHCHLGKKSPPVWHLVFIQHLLRGLESQRDEAFLRDSGDIWARFVNPPRSIHVLPGVPEEGWKPGAFEAAARAIRYHRIFELAKTLGIKTVATAHTLDDQAETVLYRLMRGTGTSGLVGIRSVVAAKNGQPALIRPLLAIQKEDLRSWLTKERVPWLEDSSNLTLAPDRNYLRHQVFPQLFKRWGRNRVLRGLCRLSRDAEKSVQLAQKYWDKQIHAMELPKAGTRVVWQSSKAKIKRLKDLVCCLHRLWQREKWPAKEWSRQRFIRLAKWIQSGGKLEELPNGWRLYLDEHVLRFDPPENWSARDCFGNS